MSLVCQLIIVSACAYSSQFSPWPYWLRWNRWVDYILRSLYSTGNLSHTAEAFGTFYYTMAEVPADGNIYRTRYSPGKIPKKSATISLAITSTLTITLKLTITVTLRLISRTLSKYNLEKVQLRKSSNKGDSGSRTRTYVLQCQHANHYVTPAAWRSCKLSPI